MQKYESTQNVSRRQHRCRKRRRKRRRLGWTVCLLFTIVLLLLTTFSKKENPRALHQGVNDALTDATASTGGDALTADEKLAVIQTSAEYPLDMVEFAQKYPQVIDYVYEYPSYKNSYTTTAAEVDLSPEISGDAVPLLIQWDARWGYIPYGDGLIGYTGCGPVCLSMVALYLTGDTEWTPARVAEFAEEQGYYVSGSGTSWTLISEGSRSMGLHAEVLPLVETAMKSELDKGHPIILVVGPGDFTYSGHYLVVVGYDEEGFQLNDPNSYENSAKTWSYDRLSSQIRNLWAMSVA